MSKALVILCVLIWTPIFIYQLGQRPFIVLLIWLFIAPVATNLIYNPGSNPFFASPQTGKIPAQVTQLAYKDAYMTDPETFKPQQLREPTRILISALFIVFLLDALAGRKRLTPLDKTEIWMGIFCLISTASVLFQSTRLLFGLHTVLDAFVIPFLGYYIARRLVTSEDRFRQLTQVVGYMGCYLIVICLIERLVHRDVLHRVGGPIGALGLSMVMVVVFSMVLLDSTHSWGPVPERQALPRGVRWFVLCLSPIILALGQMRGNLVGFLLSIVVLMWLGRRLINRARSLAAIGLILLLAPMTIVGLPGLLPKAVIADRIKTGNLEGRFATWTLAIQEGIKHPIFGLGLNNSRDVLSTNSLRFGTSGSFSTIHNSILAILVEQGVVGFFLYMAIVGSIIRMGVSLYRTGPRSWERWGGVVVVAIMVVHLGAALFSVTLHTQDPARYIHEYVCIGAIAGLHGRNRAVAAFYTIPWHSRQMRTDLAVVAHHRIKGLAPYSA